MVFALMMATLMQEGKDGHRKKAKKTTKLCNA